MEQLESKSLPKILKFSNISCILVYYGQLHEWKTLMELLNTATSKTWRDNLEAFIKWGENHKSQLFINPESQRFENFLSNFDHNYKFISGFWVNLEWIDNIFPIIMDALNNDKILLAYTLKSKGEATIGIRKPKETFRFRYIVKLEICSEEEASTTAPAIKCPNFKHQYNRFDNLNLFSWMKSDLCNYILWFVKTNGFIQFEKIKNQIIRFEFWK